MAYMDEMIMAGQGNGNIGGGQVVNPAMPGGPADVMTQGPEAEVQELLMLRDQIDQRLAELGLPVNGVANDPMAGMTPPPINDPMAMAGIMPTQAPGLLG